MESRMSKSNSSKLHIAMFPWFAFGHFIPFLHLSNRLAEKGHRISFLLPKGAQPKLELISQYPNLILFIPLVVPDVDGLPSGAETVCDIPRVEHMLFAIGGFDQTLDQVEAILRAIKPDMIFYDFGHRIPTLARQIGIKSLFYCVFSAAACAQIPKKVAKEPIEKERKELPPGYPSSKVRIKAEEVPAEKPVTENLLSFLNRIATSMEESDAMALRTCREIDGPFCDYVAQQFGKSILLTGLCFPETKTTQLEEKWANWLSNFEPSSVVFCAFGSQITLPKDKFQELLLGFELSGLPFMVALKPPLGCTTIEEALPEGFQERVQGRGLVHGGWVPQQQLLRHPSVGCFVNHCGYGTMLESLLSDCQIVLIPHLVDQILNTRFMVEELKVAVEVKMGENMQISKEHLSKAIKLVMDKDSEMAHLLKENHAKLKLILSNQVLQKQYINNFIQGLQDLISNCQ